MIQYRLARSSDALELQKLNNIFNGEECSTLSVIEDSLNNNTQEIVCVAETGKELIGFCCGQLFKSFCYSVNYGEITELFVIGAYRRQGVASGLLLSIESEFQKLGINDFQLFTGKENSAAQALYRKQGYAESPELMLRKRHGIT